MIERINLIEKRKFSFSYRSIIQAGVFVAMICGAVYGFQIYRGTGYQKSMTQMNSEITLLKVEREQLLKEQPKKLTEGSHQELQNIFITTPKWAALLADIGQRLPNKVWLTGLKASSVSAGLPMTDAKPIAAPTPAVAGAPPAPPPAPKSQLVMNGVADQVGQLGDFVDSLIESPYIDTANLLNTRKEETYFTFEIICDMVPESS